MRTIKLIEHISLDGVMQHTADDDAGFAHADWTVPYRTPAGREAILAAYGARFDVLLGRRTYDLWSDFWPKAPKGDAMADAHNAGTKYVVTHRPETLAWAPAEPVGTDVAEGVRRIKACDGPPIVLSGSSTLVATLLEHELVDEIALVIYPIVLGAGKRLFADVSSLRKFELARTMTTPTGVIIADYRAVMRHC